MERDLTAGFSVFVPVNFTASGKFLLTRYPVPPFSRWREISVKSANLRTCRERRLRDLARFSGQMLRRRNNSASTPGAGTRIRPRERKYGDVNLFVYKKSVTGTAESCSTFILEAKIVGSTETIQVCLSNAREAPLFLLRILPIPNRSGRE